MYKELINGAFVPQDISYPTLMKKHVKNILHIFNQYLRRLAIL